MLEAYEILAKRIFKQGQNYLAEGNTCSLEVSLLSYIEKDLELNGFKSPLVSALVDSLSTENMALRHYMLRHGKDDE